MKNLVVGLVAATLALAACGGSSKSSANPAAGGTTVSTEANAGGGTGFSDLVNKAKTADYKVTYTTDNGDSATLAQDGQGKISYTTKDSVLISDGTNTISCDGTTSSAKCTDLGSAGKAQLAGLMSVFTAAYASLSALRTSAFGGHTTSETIAGRDATCVSFKASDVAGGILAGKIPGDPSVTSCVDKEDGYVLKYETSVNDETTTHFLATAAGPSSPSDFEPPSTPRTVPNITLPSGITLPNGITLPSP